VLAVPNLRSDPALIGIVAVTRCVRLGWASLIGGASSGLCTDFEPPGCAASLAHLASSAVMEWRGSWK
jgi:hypothetical protein